MKRMLVLGVLALLSVSMSGCMTSKQWAYVKQYHAKAEIAKENVLDGLGISVGMSSQDVEARGYVCAQKVTSTAGEVDQCATPEAWDKYSFDEDSNADPTIGGYGITVGFDNDFKVVYVQQE